MVSKATTRFLEYMAHISYILYTTSRTDIITSRAVSGHANAALDLSRSPCNRPTVHVFTFSVEHIIYINITCKTLYTIGFFLFFTYINPFAITRFREKRSEILFLFFYEIFPTRFLRHFNKINFFSLPCSSIFRRGLAVHVFVFLFAF